MVDKHAEKVGKLVPEFFFDLIARIIPGSLFIFAYSWHYFLFESRSIPAIVYIGIIPVGYLIGLSGHVVSRFTLSRLLASPRLACIIPAPGYVRSRELLTDFEKLSESQHNLLTKMMAESGFYRTCVTLCIPLLIYPVPSPLTSTPCYYVMVGVAALVLLFCHIDCQRHLKIRLNVFLGVPIYQNLTLRVSSDAIIAPVARNE